MEDKERIILTVYRMIHHLPAHGQQYVLDSVVHIQTGVVQQDDILVSKLGCLQLLAQQMMRRVLQSECAMLAMSEFQNDQVLKYHRHKSGDI
jgi:hypothetical protein